MSLSTRAFSQGEGRGEKKSEDPGSKWPTYGAVQRAVERTSETAWIWFSARHYVPLWLVRVPPPSSHALSTLSLDLRLPRNLASQSGCLISPIFFILPENSGNGSRTNPSNPFQPITRVALRPGHLLTQNGTGERRMAALESKPQRCLGGGTTCQFQVSHGQFMH